MYIKRHIEDAVLKRAKMKGAVVVTGARQVGKTTLIKNLKKNITHLTLDDLRVRRAAIDEQAAFFDLNPPPIFIDEVQYAPALFHYIKILLDKSRNKGDFFLTGSQSFELMENVTESLAGRAGILELLGLSLREIRSEVYNTPFLPTTEYLVNRKKTALSLSIKEAWRIIHRGSMPELIAEPTFDWQDFYADYVKTYIERDVRKLAQVGDEADFLKFMTVVAAMTGQMLNLASLARTVRISEPTAKRWLSILRGSGLVYILKPYYNNAIKRAVKTPKIHFLDIGLAAYLTRWLTPETLSTGAMSGYFFESFIFAEILRSYTNAGKEADFYFLRDGNQREIDLLIHENNTLYPLEIKTHTEPTQDDIKHFSMIENVKNLKIGAGGVICLANELLPIKDKYKIIPVSFI
ncbi:MAG: ATP-binding protein [Spirochaetaceae bacterium]|nr:ATP-binding protein [Spirochaetaceae bacterium]